jgi:uncharacterized membrane protein YjdF
MKKGFDILNKILLYSFFIVAVVLLVRGSERISTMLVAFGMFIVSIAAAWTLKYKGISDKYWLWINIALALNLLGEIFAYYAGPLIYDKLLHLLLGIVLAAIVFEYYKNNSVLKKDMAFLTVLGMLAIWEIYEYTLDVFFGFQSQGIVRGAIFTQSKIDDTMYDLIMGAIGAVTYLFFKKEKMVTVIRKNLKIIEKRSRLSFLKFIKKILWP